MKFAVIEYNSKSGQIWKHTPERPNYLCDPIKEIDPTSFGCYVSALEGEHIPLLALIRPKVTDKVIKRLTGRWPGGYDIGYLKNFDALMVVYQISDGHEMVRFVEHLKKALPHIPIVGVPTQPWGLLQQHWKMTPGARQEITDFMNACDVFLTIVESTKKQWQDMTTTRVEYLPQPYPVQYASKYAQPVKEKGNIIFVAGVTERPNIKKGQRVAARLQQEFPEYIIHVTKIEDMPLDEGALAGARYEVVPFQHWQEHLEYLSNVKLVINTDYTQTRGRVQVDCAAVGTPSIGADSDGQVDLFPDFVGHPDQSEDELCEYARRLLGDSSVYTRTVETAHTKLAEYSYEKSAERLRHLITSIG